MPSGQGLKGDRSAGGGGMHGGWGGVYGKGIDLQDGCFFVAPTPQIPSCLCSHKQGFWVCVCGGGG